MKTKETKTKEIVAKDIPFRPDCYYSTNYKQFQMGTNRKIKRAHLEKLMISINELGYIPQFRVLVTKNGFIIDGQHRLMAAMEVKKGYYYEICDLSTGLIALLNNLQLKWKGIDYVEYYAHEKKKDYVELLKLINNYNDFSYASIISVVGGGIRGVTGQLAQQIATGNFVLTSKDKDRVIQMLGYLTSFSQYIPIYKSSKLVRAFLHFYNQIGGAKVYSNDKMKEAIRKHKAKFLSGNETIFYYQIFKEIYK